MSVLLMSKMPKMPNFLKIILEFRNLVRDFNILGILGILDITLYSHRTNKFINSQIRDKLNLLVKYKRWNQIVRKLKN